MGQAATAFADLSRFNTQWLVERHGLDTLHGHFGGHGENITKLIELAHGIIENSGDNSAVAVARRPGVALAEPEAADEPLAGIIEKEFQAHALEIVLAAGKAEILFCPANSGEVASYRFFHKREL